MYKIIDAFDDDHPQTVDCQVKGCLPDWLQGSLYRNGPGKYSFGHDEYYHLCDGMAVLHQYSIKDGHVTYRNRLLDSETYKRNLAANRIVVSEFGVIAHPDPCKCLFSRYFTYFAETLKLTDNDCVNLIEISDQIYAMTETPVMNKINRSTLQSSGQVDWRSYVSVTMATAHPMKEADGSVYNMGIKLGLKSSYKLIKISPPQPGDDNPVKSARIVASLPAQWPLMPNYFHSFGTTENYVVFIEQPLAINFLKVGTGRISDTSVLDAFHFYKGYKTKFLIIHKHTGSRIKLNYVAEAFFVFHHINAYEDDGQVVVDLCTYGDSSILQYMTLDNLRSPRTPMPKPTFKRFVLPLSVNKKNVNLVSLPYTCATARASSDDTVTCVPDSIPHANIELPRIHYEKYNGRKYRYVYGVNTDRLNLNQIAKVDIEKRTMKLWSEQDYFIGEPVFVPHPEATLEDDGVILSPVIRLKDDLSSFLLILDAKTFTELARAYIPSDVNVPYSFHGIFTNT